MYAAPITSMYAALLGIMFTAITLRIALIRNVRSLSMGHGGDLDFEKLIRGQANFTETVPIALILIYLLEHQGTAAVTLHTLGIALLLGRISHYLQLTGALQHIIFRVIGMVLTLSAILIASTRLLLGY